ncbi:MAG: GNAT family N-acetyltransferase [Spirochaetaceae bacterium]|jgi:predicted acetyltransferase|nr:GNAT family N-acetyltransferase [Spirochaetaceae bacterium]
MEITVEKILEDEKPTLATLLRAMKHCAEGEELHYLEGYWTDEERVPYFIRADGDIAGFVLLNKYFWILQKAKTNYGVAEIYVRPEMRLKGIAYAAMVRIFELHPGNWEIRPLDGSADAQAFWERTLETYTCGNYKTTCFGKYKRPLYTLQAPVVDKTGLEVVYRPAFGEIITPLPS